jgi:cytochrome c biogenesis protein CcmG, thiol:disulfide interchange protein DsbE
MKTKEKSLWIAVFLVAGAYLLPVAQSRFAFARSSPAARATAPEFSLKTLAGKNIHLSEFQGRVVLVNFFASWCPPCKKEIPGFEKAYTSFKNQGFVVIGIALDEVPPSFVRRMGITYPLVAADDRVTSDYGNVASVPVSFLIGKDGKVINKVMGIYSEADLKNDVENALKGKI